MKTLFISLIFVLGGLSAYASGDDENCTKNTSKPRYQTETPKQNDERNVAAVLNTTDTDRERDTVDSTE